MVRTDGCIIFQKRNNHLNFHTQELKSRSNDKSRESNKSFKHHIREMGPVYRSRFKTFDDEFADNLRKAELLDRNNCIWLSSSGSTSPSSCFQENGLSRYTDVKIDAWFISLLSSKPLTRPGEILSTKVTFFDGSHVNPIEEASLVLDTRKDSEKDLIFTENLEEKEVVSWLASCDIGNQLLETSVSSITDSSSDDYSIFSSSSSSDYSSEVVDLEEIGTDKPLFWPSDWTSEWDSDTFFIMSPRKDKSTPHAFEESRTKTPVFWPSNCAPEWGSDTKWDLFVMSPKKDINSFSKSQKTTPDTLRVRVLNGNMSCSRRLEFSSCDLAEVKSEVKSEVKPEVKPLTEKCVRKHKIVLEDLLLVDKLNVDGAIEEALGLDEFDGHEGLEFEFDKDEFSL